jgi:hypothetical protein
MAVTHSARRALAEQHVEEGRRVIERQRQLIARKKVAYSDTIFAEELLDQFLLSQRIFEDDLTNLIRTGG